MAFDVGGCEIDVREGGGLFLAAGHVQGLTDL